MRMIYLSIWLFSYQKFLPDRSNCLSKSIIWPRNWSHPPGRCRLLWFWDPTCGLYQQWNRCSQLCPQWRCWCQMSM